MRPVRRTSLALASTALTLAVGATVAPAASATTWPMPPVPAGPYAQPSAGQLAALRGCESGGNYAINTGNGYYGAYQFDRGTWNGLGFPGTANQAPAAVQDRAATILEVERGWAPWPACSRNLGLTTTTARVSRTAVRPALPAWTVGAHLTASTVQSQHAVQLLGHVDNAPVGLIVYEQVLRGGVWQTMARTGVQPNTGFAFTLRPGPRGPLKVRVLVSPTGHYRTTPTGPLTLNVV